MSYINQIKETFELNFSKINLKIRTSVISFTKVKGGGGVHELHDAERGGGSLSIMPWHNV